MKLLKRLSLFLHQLTGLYSFLAGSAPCNASYIVATCSLVIDRDRLLVNLYRFHYYPPLSPSCVALFEHLGCAPYESHKYRCAMTGILCDNKQDIKINSIKFVIQKWYSIHNTSYETKQTLTCGSMLNFKRRVVTVFCIRLLYEALPAAFRHRSPSSIKQQIWSAGPRESSSPVLNPLLFIFQFLLVFFFAFFFVLICILTPGCTRRFQSLWFKRNCLMHKFTISAPIVFYNSSIYNELFVRILNLKPSQHFIFHVFFSFCMRYEISLHVTYLNCR